MLKGKPAGENDIVTMHAIKSILSTYEDAFETETQAPAAHTQDRAAEAALTLQPVKEIDTKVAAARFTSVPSGANLSALEQAAPKASAKKAKVKKPARRMSLPKMKRIAVSKYITPRVVAIGLMFLLAVFNPGILIFGLLGVMFAIVGAFVLFGADRVWGTVSRALAAYERRDPKKAARLMVGLDAFAVKWDSFLDRFPEGSVDGLYLPDFANYASEQEAVEAKMDDRLARMHNQV